MKNILILFTIALLVTGCGDHDHSPKNQTVNYNLPSELSDCTVHDIDGHNVNEVTVVRCPHSDTTTTWTESCGKNCTRTRTTVILDGIEYKKTEK